MYNTLKRVPCVKCYLEHGPDALCDEPIIVTRTKSSWGEKQYVFSAWERSSPTGAHSIITFFGNKCYGKIGTSPDRRIYQHLPRGEDRVRAVDLAYDEEHCRAYTAIHSAFPETKQGENYDGEVTLKVS